MKLLSRLLSHKTHKEVAINTFGTYLNVAFSAIYIVVIARFFTPTENGIYIVLFTLVYVFTNLFDFGTSATIYSYLPPLLRDKIKAYSFLKITLVYQTALAFGAIIILCLFITPINVDWLKLNVPLRYFMWSFGTIPLLIWQNFILNTLFASRRFTTANILINTINIVRLVILLGLQFTNHMSFELLLILFGPFGPFLFFILLYLAHPNVPKQLIDAPLDKQHLNISYSATYFAATQLYFIASRIDLFLIAHFLTKPEVGYYGLAQKVVFSILTTINSVTQVLSPQFAIIETRSEVVELIKRFALYCLLPVGLLIGSIITPDAIYTLVFSDTYKAVPHITRLLSFVNIFFVVMQIPMLFFLYTIKKPSYVLVSNAILLVTTGIGSYVLTQQFGITGPPVALLISFCAVTLYAYTNLYKEYKLLKR